jgi:CheY-like chemotaxis protein
VILLVGQDPRFEETLRLVARKAGLAVLQAGERNEVLRLAACTQPAAILLDLDLPFQAAWEIADALLKEATCPTLILLTEHTDQFDWDAAFRAEHLVSKFADPGALARTLEQTAVESASCPGERNAIQRVLIRWMRPSAWPVPVTPAFRFWGINE